MKQNKMVQFTLTVICAAVLAACGSSGGGSDGLTISPVKPDTSATNTTGSTANNGGTTTTTPSDNTASNNTGTTTPTDNTANNGGTTTTPSDNTASNNTGTTTPTDNTANNGGTTTTPSDNTASNNTGTTTPTDNTANNGTDTGTTTPTDNTASNGDTSTPVDTKPSKDYELTGDPNKNTTTLDDKSNVGYKHVAKQNSNFALNTGDKTHDTPIAMSVQNPFPSLDTLVLAEPTGSDAKGDGKRGYLEDFDFRGNGDNDDGINSGKFSLKHIYKDAANDKKAGTLTGKPRGTDEGVGGLTKTDTMGGETGDALVFQKDRRNYTTDYHGNLLTSEGKVELTRNQVDSTNANVDATNGTRTGEGTVAEVYGHRTFATGGDYDKDKFNADTKNNLPLYTPKSTEDAAKLEHVQYGRVTSALNEKTLANFKDGLNIGPVKTFVVNYGEMGKDGTENHYFYRGVGNTTINQLEALVQQGGTLEYNGHAVTYGLHHNWTGEQIRIPNAVGGALGMVSGTHVKATVDLGNLTVKGSLYNNWYSSAENGVKGADLVTFKGNLATNGNIAGTATNVYEEKVGDKANKDGVFGATLFGDKAQEMGGVISSSNKGDNAWGAVFGAKRYIPEPTKEPEKEPEKPQPGGLGNAVDQSHAK